MSMPSSLAGNMPSGVPSPPGSCRSSAVGAEPSTNVPVLLVTECSRSNNSSIHVRPGKGKDIEVDEAVVEKLDASSLEQDSGPHDCEFAVCFSAKCMIFFEDRL